MYEQVSSGICQDITKPVTEGGFKDTFYPAAIDNFTAGGKIYGVPNDVTAMLMMRILGKDGMEAVYQVKNGGFASPDVVKAFQLFRDFAALKPFQDGYLANTYDQAAGTFQDGKTAFHLMGSRDLVELFAAGPFALYSLCHLAGGRSRLPQLF